MPKINSLTPSLLDLSSIDESFLENTDSPLVVLDTKAVGLRLKRARVSLGLNQHQVAEKSTIALKQPKLSLYENGNFWPTVSNLRHILVLSEELGSSFHDILFGSTDTEYIELSDLIVETLNSVTNRVGAGLCITDPIVVLPKENLAKTRPSKSGPVLVDSDTSLPESSPFRSLLQPSGGNIIKNIQSSTKNAVDSQVQEKTDNVLVQDNDEPVSVQQGGDNSPGQSFVSNSNTYNLSANLTANDLSNAIADPQTIAFKELPVFDIDEAVKAATGTVVEGAEFISLRARRTTFIPSNSKAYGINISEDIYGVADSVISRRDVLLVEPTLKPRNGNLVVVALNAKDKERITGVIGKLSVDLGNRYYLQTPGGTKPEPMPAGSIICGVIVRVERDLVDPASVKAREDDSYDIWSTYQETVV